MFVTWTLASDVGLASPAVQVLVTARRRLQRLLNNGPPVLCDSVWQRSTRHAGTAGRDERGKRRINWERQSVLIFCSLEPNFQLLSGQIENTGTLVTTQNGVQCVRIVYVQSKNAQRCVGK